MAIAFGDGTLMQPSPRRVVTLSIILLLGLLSACTGQSRAMRPQLSTDAADNGQTSCAGAVCFTYAER